MTTIINEMAAEFQSKITNIFEHSEILSIDAAESIGKITFLENGKRTPLYQLLQAVANTH